jgi:hypothetical protein
MLAKKVDDFKACVQNGKPCNLLIGFFTEEEWKKYYGEIPYMAHGSCRIGYECGRAEFFRFDPSKT